MGDKLRITIKYIGAFSEAAKSKKETYELSTPLLSALIDDLVDRKGEKFQFLLIDPTTQILRTGITLLVNGHGCDLHHALVDGDEVTLLVPIAGG